jgi:hypothetical protein
MMNSLNITHTRENSRCSFSFVSDLFNMEIEYCACNNPSAQIWTNLLTAAILGDYAHTKIQGSLSDLEIIVSEGFVRFKTLDDDYTLKNEIRVPSSQCIQAFAQCTRADKKSEPKKSNKGMPRVSKLPKKPVPVPMRTVCPSFESGFDSSEGPRTSQTASRSDESSEDERK